VHICGTILGTNTKIEICKECYEKIDFKEGASISFQGQYNYYDSVVCVCDYSGIVKEAIRNTSFTISLLITEPLHGFWHKK